MGRKQIRVSESRTRHRFHFRNPRNLDMDKLAQRIIALRLVQDVILQDHEEGFHASIKFYGKLDPVRARAYIASNISKDYGEVTLPGAKQ
ncbi:MAG: hypothetical protein LVQ95_00325 [Candidatus Micrarchaeales archaeon]|nr:hypothetical protein [Candidatus Micrarchaeales archaeon]